MTTFFFVLSTAKWQENSNSRLQSSLSLLSLLSLIKEYDDDDDSLYCPVVCACNFSLCQLMFSSEFPSVTFCQIGMETCT